VACTNYLSPLDYQFATNKVRECEGAPALHTLLSAGRLNTLFVNTVRRLIAGEPFTPLLQGTTLPLPAGFRLSSLCYDAAAVDGVGQTFARYDRMGS
jgi:hypothetical protein